MYKSFAGSIVRLENEPLAETKTRVTLANQRYKTKKRTYSLIATSVPK